MTKTNLPEAIKIKPDKRFQRLDKPFNDAVRSKEKSAVTSVLLRAELSGDLAARTAAKVLADHRRPSRQNRRKASENRDQR